MMKICPECRTKNDDVNNFCKKCGFFMTGSWFKEKREKGLEGRKKSQWIFISLILIGLILGAVAFWIIQEKITAHPKIAVQQKVRHEKVLEGIRH